MKGSKIRIACVWRDPANCLDSCSQTFSDTGGITSGCKGVQVDETCRDVLIPSGITGSALRATLAVTELTGIKVVHFIKRRRCRDRKLLADNNNNKRFVATAKSCALYCACKQRQTNRQTRQTLSVLEFAARSNKQIAESYDTRCEAERPLRLQPAGATSLFIFLSHDGASVTEEDFKVVSATEQLAP